MRIENLPSPGQLSNGINLRGEAARAISFVETVAPRVGGTTGTANYLHTFFTACATAVASFRDLTAPSVTARTQPVGGNTITITHSEGLDAGVLPALTSFVTSPGRTITGLEVQGTKLLVTYSGTSLANGNTIAYTAPGVNALRDAGGNLLPSFGASAIAVA